MLKIRSYRSIKKMPKLVVNRIMYVNVVQYGVTWYHYLCPSSVIFISFNPTPLENLLTLKSLKLIRRSDGYDVGLLLGRL